MDEAGYHEGFYSLLDDGRPLDFARHASEPALLAGLRDDWAVRRLAWFSKGFYAVRRAPAEVAVATESLSTMRQLFTQVPTATAAGEPCRRPPAGRDVRPSHGPDAVVRLHFRRRRA
jgi:hypothetical protein